MIFTPFKYFIKRYYSIDLKPYELKRMLNLWVPFIFNRIKIMQVSNDFRKIDVRLKLSFWNRNPGKAIWGGAIFSAADSFYPIMLKQNALYNGLKTQFFTKSTQVQYIKESKTDLMFSFELTENEVFNMVEILKENGKYQEWHTVYGIDDNSNKCVKVKIQPYLRVRI